MISFWKHRYFCLENYVTSLSCLIQFLPLTEIKAFDINSYFRHTPLACSPVISPGTYYPTTQPNYGIKILLIAVYGTYVIATSWFRLTKFQFANVGPPYTLVASLRYIWKTVCCLSLTIKAWNFSGIGTISGITSQSETLPAWYPHSTGCNCFIPKSIPTRFTPVKWSDDK